MIETSVMKKFISMFPSIPHQLLQENGRLWNTVKKMVWNELKWVRTLSLNPQNWLYFQGFWASKLLNGWFEPSHLACEEFSHFQDSKLVFMISDFKIFRKNSSETTEFWCIVGLIAIKHLLQRKKYTFFTAA